MISLHTSTLIVSFWNMSTKGRNLSWRRQESNSIILAKIVREKDNLTGQVRIQTQCYINLVAVRRKFPILIIQSKTALALLSWQTGVMFLRNLRAWNAIKSYRKHGLHTIATRIEKSWMWSSTLDMMDWSCRKQIKTVCSCSKSQRDTKQQQQLLLYRTFKLVELGPRPNYAGGIWKQHFHTSNVFHRHYAGEIWKCKNHRWRELQN